MYRQCCHRGKISVSPFFKPVGEVGALYTGNSPLSQGFRKNIRMYNNLMSFGLVKAKYQYGRGRGPFFLRINGEVTNFIDWANPRQEGVTTDRGQIYFLEGIDESVEASVERSRLLDCAANERIVLFCFSENTSVPIILVPRPIKTCARSSPTRPFKALSWLSILFLPECGVDGECR